MVTMAGEEAISTNWNTGNSIWNNNNSNKSNEPNKQSNKTTTKTTKTFLLSEWLNSWMSYSESLWSLHPRRCSKQNWTCCNLLWLTLLDQGRVAPLDSQQRSLPNSAVLWVHKMWIKNWDSVASFENWQHDFFKYMEQAYFLSHHIY